MAYLSISGVIYVLYKILHIAVFSTAESKLGALFLNAQKSVFLRTIFEELDHVQPCTPIQIDNSSPIGIIDNNIRPNESSSMDMLFIWVNDCVNQGQFIIYLGLENNNLADNFTNYFPVIYYCTIWSLYLY